MSGLRLCVLIFGVLLTGVSAAQNADQVRIESQLWLQGERQEVAPMVIGVDEPGFLLSTDEEGRAEEGSWRLELRSSPVDDPLGLSQSLWVEVRLSLFRAGFWEPVLDSILGVPEGEFSSLSVTPDDQTPSPEASEVYLRLRTERVQTTDTSAAIEET